MSTPLPGVATTPRTARLLGGVVVLVVVVVLIVWRLVPSGNGPAEGHISVTLITDAVGAGISAGTEVRRDGVMVGSVAEVERSAGLQRLDLELDSVQIDGLTDTLSIDYAPANLFGITQLTLRDGDGGSRLQPGTELDLSGLGADRVHDATTSTLLLSLGRLTSDVLTPELGDLLDRVARDTKAFTPLMQAMVTTIDTIAQTQRIPYSPILKGLGDTLLGFPHTLRGGLVLLNSVYEQPYLRDDANREAFDTTVAILAEDLIPSISQLLTDLKPDYEPLANLPIPLMDAVTGTLSPPGAVSEDLSLLLDRIDRSFADSPAGPILRLAVELGASGSGAASTTGSGGGR